MLYPQNGDRIVTTYSVTSLHPMYSEFLHFTRKTLKITIWLCNSMTDLHKIWHDDAQRLSSAPAVTNLTLTSRMRAADMPQRSVLLHQQISRLMAAVRHLVFLKLKFLTATHIRDMFCTNVSTFVEICHCCRDVAIFRVFSVKCKNALDDRA